MPEGYFPRAYRLFTVYEKSWVAAKAISHHLLDTLKLMNEPISQRMSDLQFSFRRE
jgi:hypothetical protein